MVVINCCHKFENYDRRLSRAILAAKEEYYPAYSQSYSRKFTKPNPPTKSTIGHLRLPCTSIQTQNPPPPSSPYQMFTPRPTISPSRTPLLSHSPALPEESDGRKMKVLCLNTESWTREDVRRTITFVSAVLVGLGRSV